MTREPAPTEWIVGPDTGSPVPAAGERLVEGAARWVHLTDEQAFRTAVDALDPRLHEQAERLRAWPGGRRRPVAHYRRLADGWSLLTTPTVWYTETDRQVHTGSLVLLVGHDTVASLETGDAHVYDDALERLDAVGVVHGSGTQRVAVALLMSLLTCSSDVEVALGEAVAETERLVFDRAVDDPVTRIYELKREITEARRALLPVSAELPELIDPTDGTQTTTVERRMLERLVSAVERIDQHLGSHDGLLSDMLQVHLSQVSVRQNEDMRKISAWAAILVYPTIVAGVYGMNFAHMPELGWLWGYPLALGLMAVGCFVLYRWFRRAGWL